MKNIGHELSLSNRCQNCKLNKGFDSLATTAEMQLRLTRIQRGSREIPAENESELISAFKISQRP